MAKVRWVSSSFKEEVSNEKCPSMMGNRAERGGFGKKNGWRGVVFFVDYVLEIVW